MPRCFAIAPITTPELPPPEMVSAAARTGYSHVGLRLLPSAPGGFAWGLMQDVGLLKDTLTRMRDTGVDVLDIDIIRLRPDTDPLSFKPFLETGQALGARHVLAAGDDSDLGRLEANFAALCDLARPCDLTVDIEFVPWTAVPDLAAATRLLRAVDRCNAGIVVDTLHVDRSHTPIEALAAIPPKWLHYMQICDAPAEQPATIDAMIHTARNERLFPGEGALGLIAMMRALPACIPISLEVPKETLARTVSGEARARMAIEATREILDRLG